MAIAGHDLMNAIAYGADEETLAAMYEHLTEVSDPHCTPDVVPMAVKLNSNCDDNYLDPAEVNDVFGDWLPPLTQLCEATPEEIDAARADDGRSIHIPYDATKTFGHLCDPSNAKTRHHDHKFSECKSGEIFQASREEHPKKHLQPDDCDEAYMVEDSRVDTYSKVSSPVQDANVFQVPAPPTSTFNFSR